MPRIFVLGSLNADLVVDVPRPVQPGETLTGGELTIFPGGKGGNQAAAAARLGAEAVMVGQVGRDTFGDFLLDRQRDAGVMTTGVGRCDRASGVALISVFPDGENSIVISPGANAAVTPRLVRERLAGLEAGDFLLCQLEIPLDAVEAGLRLARDRGAVTLLDPAPARPLAPELLALVDYLTPNQTEAAILLDEPGLETGQVEQALAAASRLRASGTRNVVLKLGRLGCCGLVDGDSFAAKGFAVEAVDTTAAGDTFNAALAVALSEGLVIGSAARFANAAAAISVTRRGAQSSAPTRSEVTQLLVKPAGLL